MIRYATVTPTPEIRRLCMIAGSVAALKLGIEPPEFIFIVEDSRGAIERPRRLLGETGPDVHGNVRVLLNIGQSPEQMVATVYHEVFHLKGFSDSLQGIGPFLPEISEGAAQMFARTQTPIGGSYQTLMKDLLCDGAETALENDSPESATEFATTLQEFDPQLAESLHRRAAALDVLNAGCVSTAATAAHRAARNRQAARELQWEVAARRRTQEIATIAERMREAAARAARGPAVRRERSTE